MTSPLRLFLLVGVISISSFQDGGMIIPVALAARPSNTKESTTTSPLYRMMGGVQMALNAVYDMVIPPESVKLRSQHKIYDSTTPPPTHMQVLFVGLGRTGTTSAASAMNFLGYKVFHDDEFGQVYDLLGDYAQGMMNTTAYYHELERRGFNCSFTAGDDLEWAASQPNIKVVLTTRDDPRKWVQSWLVVAGMGDAFQSAPFSFIRNIRRMAPLYHVGFKEIPTNGHPELYKDPEGLLNGYHGHIEKVRRVIPKNRLLEFNAKQGWEPLCDFLGVPVPPQDVPFPHINDRVKVRAVATVICALPYVWPLFFLLLVVLVYFPVMWIRRLGILIVCRLQPSGGSRLDTSSTSKKLN